MPDMVEVCLQELSYLGKKFLNHCMDKIMYIFEMILTLLQQILEHWHIAQVNYVDEISDNSIFGTTIFIPFTEVFRF